jgi:hypothetical protein
MIPVAARVLVNYVNHVALPKVVEESRNISPDRGRVVDVDGMCLPTIHRRAISRIADIPGIEARLGNALLWTARMIVRRQPRRHHHPGRIESVSFRERGGAHGANGEVLKGWVDIRHFQRRNGTGLSRENLHAEAESKAHCPGEPIA